MSGSPTAVPPRLQQALEALRDGRAVVLQDDDDRENEADLIVEQRFAGAHGFPLLSIAELVEYRRAAEAMPA